MLALLAVVNASLIATPTELLHLIIYIPRVEALRTSTLGWGNATPTELPGVRTFFYGLTIHGRWERTFPQWTNYTWSLGTDLPQWANYIWSVGAYLPQWANYTWSVGAYLPQWTNYTWSVGADLPHWANYTWSVGASLPHWAILSSRLLHCIRDWRGRPGQTSLHFPHPSGQW